MKALNADRLGVNLSSVTYWDKVLKLSLCLGFLIHKQVINSAGRISRV